MEVAIKRIYEEASVNDGYRVLVDRLWPRGMSKEDAMLDEWMKEIAPSHELRKWFHQNMEAFEEFAKEYREELSGNGDLLEKIKELASQKKVTLLFASKNLQKNHAHVIREYLLGSSNA